MTEQTTTWFAVGASIYVELSARRRVRGGYLTRRTEAIGQRFPPPASQSQDVTEVEANFGRLLPDP